MRVWVWMWVCWDDRKGRRKRSERKERENSCVGQREKVQKAQHRREGGRGGARVVCGLLGHTDKAHEKERDGEKTL